MDTKNLQKKHTVTSQVLLKLSGSAILLHFSTIGICYKIVLEFDCNFGFLNERKKLNVCTPLNVTKEGTPALALTGIILNTIGLYFCCLPDVRIICVEYHHV